MLGQRLYKPFADTESCRIHAASALFTNACIMMFALLRHAHSDAWHLGPGRLVSH